MDAACNYSNSVVWRVVRPVEIFRDWAILNKVTDKIPGLKRSRVIMTQGARQG